MENFRNLVTIDYILLAIIMFFAISGLKKGFVLCIYNFCCTLFCLVFAYVCCNTNNGFLSILENNEIIRQFEGFTKTLILFIIFFVILSLLTKVISIVVRPIIDGIVKHVIIIKQLNQILGLLIGTVRGIIYAYMIVIVLLLQNSQVIQDSVVTNMVIELVPLYGEVLLEMLG
ncbi:CvpA family protein [Tannockella kyphosi]|uniref:CvpA family protein n=1 Tax=Tannockella kyphosi TaxID=2899121 RepID=UPI002012D920|nr:CvpA family protein [Tannockella kyphosi]